jgi:hypothetical protein
MSDSSDLKAWVERWKQVGPILARIRRRELRGMTEEQHRRALDAVLQLARPEIGRRQTCGLAQLYRRRDQ